MDRPVLKDETQFPTEEIVFNHIGTAKGSWTELFDFIRSEHSDFSPEWRYYNDGKSWLMKVTRKKKTIFWLSVVDGGFRVTFYFGDKAEESILQSPISDSLKDGFKTGKRYGKIRGITIDFYEKLEIENIKELIKIKLKY